MDIAKQLSFVRVVDSTSLTFTLAIPELNLPDHGDDDAFIYTFSGDKRSGANSLMILPEPNNRQQEKGMQPHATEGIALRGGPLSFLPLTLGLAQYLCRPILLPPKTFEAHAPKS
jgi:hypothetical protein